MTAAILERMRAEGSADVKLDLREIDPARFPNVFASLADAGLQPLSEPVPVAPAAHYMMGGVAVDLDGRSSLPGLYAVGECSCTGLHGANRLASNSLSECFVFGGRAAEAAVEEVGDAERPPLPEWRFEPPTEATREAVWRLAGPLRNPDRPRRADLQPLPAGDRDRDRGAEPARVAGRPPAQRLPGDRCRPRRGPLRPLPRRQRPPRGVALTRRPGCG